MSSSGNRLRASRRQAVSRGLSIVLGIFFQDRGELGRALHVRGPYRGHLHPRVFLRASVRAADELPDLTSLRPAFEHFSDTFLLVPRL